MDFPFDSGTVHCCRTGSQPGAPGCLLQAGQNSSEVKKDGHLAPNRRGIPRVTMYATLPKILVNLECLGKKIGWHLDSSYT